MSGLDNQPTLDPGLKAGSACRGRGVGGDIGIKQLAVQRSPFESRRSFGVVIEL